MRKITMLALLLAGFALPLFGDSVHDAAIRIDGGKASIEKWRILNAAEGIMRLRNNMDGLDEKTEQQILKDVFLDFESWLLAMVEAADRGVQMKEVGQRDFLAFKAESPYGKVNDQIVNQMAFAGTVISKKILELDHVDLHNGNVRDLILARYRSRHRIEITDYTVWKVNRN